jgi:hypothetical protein
LAIAVRKRGIPQKVQPQIDWLKIGEGRSMKILPENPKKGSLPYLTFCQITNQESPTRGSEGDWKSYAVTSLQGSARFMTSIEPNLRSQRSGVKPSGRLVCEGLMLLRGGPQELMRPRMPRVLLCLPKVFVRMNALRGPVLKRAPYNLCCL